MRRCVAGMPQQRARAQSLGRGHAAREMTSTTRDAILTGPLFAGETEVPRCWVSQSAAENRSVQPRLSQYRPAIFHMFSDVTPWRYPLAQYALYIGLSSPPLIFVLIYTLSVIVFSLLLKIPISS